MGVQKTWVQVPFQGEEPARPAPSSDTATQCWGRSICRGHEMVQFYLKSEWVEKKELSG